MKSKRRLFHSLCGSAPLQAVFVMSFAASSAFSAIVTWDGGGVGGTVLETPANWSGDALPSIATPDTATWNGSVTGALALTYGTGLGGAAGNLGLNLNLTAAQTATLSIDSATNTAVRINNVTLDSGSGAFTLGDGTGTGATAFAITLGGATGQTHTWANNSSNTATINSDVVFGLGGGGVHALLFSGTGIWDVKDNLTVTNAATAGVQFALQKTGTGTLNLSGGGSLKNGPTAFGGAFGSVFKEGVTNMTAGTYAYNSTELVVGGLDTVGTNTQLNLSNAGTISGVSWLSLGRGNGTGSVSSDLTLSNTSSISASNLSGGFNAGGATAPKGIITLNNASSVTVTNTVNIAESANSNITLNLNGTSTFKQTANANQTKAGMADGAVGTINVAGGTATFERDFILGAGGTGQGKLIISSGTVNAATTTERWLILNQATGTGSGVIEVNGGTLNLNTNTDIRMSQNAGSAGTNTVTLSSGAITGYSANQTGLGAGSVVDLANSGTAAANNSFNLNGGTLSIGQIITNSNTPTAAFNFNGGILKANGSSANFVDLGGASQTVNVKSGGAIIDSNSFNVTVVDSLKNGVSGTDGGLTKSGAGTLTLPATNTYTGPTLVNGGTLLISGTIANSSSLTINGSGAKATQTSLTASPLPVTVTQGTFESSAQIKSLTVANSATNTITAGAVPAYSMIIDDALTFQGAATLNLRANGNVMDQAIDGSTSMALTTPGDGATNGQVTVNVSNTGAWSGGTDYPLIRYSSFSGDISDFTLGTISGLSPRQTPSLIVSDNSIALRITGDSLRWTGAKTADWTAAAVGTPYNWVLPSSSAGTDFITGDVVIFDDNAGSNTNVNVAQNVTPGSTLFDNTVDYTLSSTGGFGIAGGSLIKNNTGKVTISTTNTYTGTTTINGGTLEISGTGSIATSSAITNNSNLVFNPSGAPSVCANTIAGIGAISKIGTGTLTLSGANTFTGNFNLDAGQLNLNSAGALGAGSGIININGGTLDNTSGTTVSMTPNKAQTWNADISFIGTNSLYMSNGAVTLPATRTVDVQANIFGCGAVVDAGAGHSLVKTGAGKLVLNGGNIGGNLDIQNGIVAINQDFLGGAPIGTGILQNDGAVGTKWTFWYGTSNVSSNLLIRNNDGTNTRQLGIVKRGPGTLTLTNPSNVATANLSVDAGKVVVNAGTYGARNDDGTTNTGLTSIIGWDAAANGVLEINGATVNYNNRSNAGADVWRSTLNVGANATGAGALKLNSGTLTTDKQLALGSIAGAFGAMTQSGGTTSIGGFLALGLGTAQGVLNLNGGTFTLTTGPVTNGAGAGSVGVINLSGTAVYNHNSAANNAIWLGEAGTGILNVSGSAALNIVNNGLELGRNNVATANGIVNLLGGNVTAKYVSKPGAAATGTLNFNGGTLTANGASTTYLTGLTNAFVHAGGGTVNNGGNAITIGQSLLAPTGNGVSASGLTVSGGGFIDTPIVTITGDGTGATAVATIDGSGNLTGITITNPGVGYTAPPTFALVGGGAGNTGAISGSATLVPNTSGSMTFSGAALTTLSGTNTYTGNSTINSGTTLILAGGSSLKFTPGANTVSNKVTGSGTAAFYGNFNIDTSSAAIANSNSWTLVDVTSKTYDTLLFNVPGFTEDEVENTWTKVDGDNTWVFDEDTGILTLSVAAPAGFESWVSGFGLGAGDQDPTDDPDGDGFSNLMEYALGGNPNSSNTGIAPTGAKSGNDFILTFTRNDLALTGGDVAITLEYGNDLATWGTPVAVPATSGMVGDVSFNISDGTPNDTVTATIPNAAATKFFARVKAVK